MRITLKKGDKCPICRYIIRKPNCWVRFHVKYNPPIVILACKYCNFAEFGLRTGEYLTPRALHRTWEVSSYMRRFGVVF